MNSLKGINEILKARKEDLHRKYSVVEIGVFGSIVRGEEKKRSDIDILVAFEKVPDLLKFIELESILANFCVRGLILLKKQL